MTSALAEACIEHDKVLLYTNGCFGYGDHGEAWITEETPFSPSPMGVGSRRGGRAADGPSREGEPKRSSILTAGFVYGPGGLFKNLVSTTP